MTTRTPFSTKHFFQCLETILIATAVTLAVIACIGYAGIFLGKKSDSFAPKANDIIVVK